MDMTLRFEIFPDDLDVIADFYQRVLGFSLVTDQRDASAPYLALRRGSVRVGAARREAPGALAAGRRPAWNWCSRWTTSPASAIGC